VKRAVVRALRTAAVLACGAVVVTGTAGCNQRAVESWLSQSEPATDGPSLYSDAALGAAFGTLKKQIPSPIHALSLLVYPDHLVLQAQDPTSPKNALQYVYRGDAVSTPVPVKLLGAGKLEDNVFPLEAAKVDAIPKLVRDATARANIPEGSVSRVLLRRNLPESMDIQFRVFVTSQRRDATFDADQSGRLLE